MSNPPEQAERAAIFLRVSTGSQDESNQIPDCEKWVKQHGYRLVETYTVHGKSAYKGKHEPELRKALDDMRHGVYTVLVVWHSDRIDRTKQLGALIAEAQSYGGRIEFVREPDLNAASGLPGELVKLIKSWGNHDYSAHLSEKVTASHNARRAAGSLIGKAPWGYVIVKRDGIKTLEPTKEGQEWVPEIYRRVASGEVLRTIIDDMNAAGLRTASKQVWANNSLSDLVRMTAYYGMRANSGALEYEALVSIDLWQQANAAIDARVRTGRGTVKRPAALLRPLCGHPDCPGNGTWPMYRIVARRGVEFYRCSGVAPERKGCGNPMVRVKELDDAVTELFSLDTSPHTVTVYHPASDHTQEILALQKEISEATARMDAVRGAELFARMAELQAAPKVAAWKEEKPTGMTKAKHWEALSLDAKRDYLSGYVVTACKPDGLLEWSIAKR